MDVLELVDMFWGDGDYRVVSREYRRFIAAGGGVGPPQDLFDILEKAGADSYFFKDGRAGRMMIEEAHRSHMGIGRFRVKLARHCVAVSLKDGFP